MASATRGIGNLFTINITDQSVSVTVSGYQDKTYTREAQKDSNIQSLLNNIFAQIAGDALKTRNVDLAFHAAHNIKVEEWKKSMLKYVEGVLLNNKCEMEAAVEANKEDLLNNIENSTIHTTFLGSDGLLITVTVQDKAYEVVEKIPEEIPYALDNIFAQIVGDAVKTQNFKLAFQAAHQIKHENQRNHEFSRIICTLEDSKITLDYADFCDQIPSENLRKYMQTNIIEELLNKRRTDEALQQVEKISDQSSRSCLLSKIVLVTFKKDIEEGVNLNLTIQKALNAAGNIPDRTTRIVRDLIEILVEKGEVDEAINLAHTISTEDKRNSSLYHIVQELLNRDDIEKALGIINTDLLNSNDYTLRSSFWDYLKKQLEETKDLQVIYSLSEKVMNQMLKRLAYDLIFITHLESGRIDEALQIFNIPLEFKPSSGVRGCLHEYLCDNIQTEQGIGNLLKIAKGLVNAPKELHEFFIDRLTNRLVSGKAINLAKKVACTPLSTSLVNEQICYQLIEKDHIEEALQLAEELPVFKDGNRIKNDSLLAVARAYESRNEPRTALEVLTGCVDYSKSVNLSAMLVRNIGRIEEEVFEDFIGIAIEESQRSEGILKTEALKFLVIALAEGYIRFGSSKYLDQAISLAGDLPEEGDGFRLRSTVKNFNLALIGNRMVNKDHLDEAKQILAIMDDVYYKGELSQEIASKMDSSKQ